MEDEKRNVKKIPIWVNFYNVSKALLSDEGIAFVASRLGKPWCLDNATVGRERLNFMRVCVEVKTEFDYPKKLKFKLSNGIIVSVDVKYLWKPPVCLNCNTFGHSTSKCGNNIVRAWKPAGKKHAPSPGNAVCTGAKREGEVVGSESHSPKSNGGSGSVPNCGQAIQGASSYEQVGLPSTRPCNSVNASELARQVEHQLQLCRSPVATIGTNPAALITMFTRPKTVSTSNRFEALVF